MRNQQKRHLLSQNDDRDPQVAFWEDLRKEAQEWACDGDQLIISGDVNNEVRDPAVETFCWMTMCPAQELAKLIRGESHLNV